MELRYAPGIIGDRIGIFDREKTAFASFGRYDKDTVQEVTDIDMTDTAYLEDILGWEDVTGQEVIVISEIIREVVPEFPEVAVLADDGLTDVVISLAEGFNAKGEPRVTFRPRGNASALVLSGDELADLIILLAHYGNMPPLGDAYANPLDVIWERRV